MEELFGDETKDIWILGDSATRIKYKGQYVYESLLPNQLGRQMIAKLATIASDHVIIACTPTAAFVTTSNDENGVLSTIEKILALQAN